MAEPISEAEKAYRRGFDQGFFFALEHSGWNNKQVQDLAFKRRLGNWRHGRQQYSLKKRQDAPKPIPTEMQEIKNQAFNVQVLGVNKKPNA